MEKYKNLNFNNIFYRKWTRSVYTVYQRYIFDRIEFGQLGIEQNISDKKFLSKIL